MRGGSRERAQQQKVEERWVRHIVFIRQFAEERDPLGPRKARILDGGGNLERGLRDVRELRGESAGEPGRQRSCQITYDGRMRGEEQRAAREPLDRGRTGECRSRRRAGPVCREAQSLVGQDAMEPSERGEPGLLPGTAR